LVAGQRKRPTFSDLQRARDEAANIAVQLTKGDFDVATMTSADRSEYLRAKQLVDPTGVSLEMAASQFADGVQRLAGVPLAHAIDFYLKRNPINMVPKMVSHLAYWILENELSLCVLDVPRSRATLRECGKMRVYAGPPGVVQKKPGSVKLKYEPPHMGVGALLCGCVGHTNSIVQNVFLRK